MMQRLERAMESLMGDWTKMQFQKGLNRYIKGLTSLMHILPSREQLQFWRLVHPTFEVFSPALVLLIFIV